MRNERKIQKNQSLELTVAVNRRREHFDQRCEWPTWPDQNNAQGEPVMLKRSALFAVAASAVIGLAVFSSTEADARRGGGHHGGGHHGHGHHGGGHHGHGHHGRHHHHHHHHRRHWHPRVIYRTYGYVRYTTPRPVGPCTCLRKTYLPNGAVLFQDVCT